MENSPVLARRVKKIKYCTDVPSLCSDIKRDISLLQTGTVALADTGDGEGPLRPMRELISRVSSQILPLVAKGRLQLNFPFDDLTLRWYTDGDRLRVIRQMLLYCRSLQCMAACNRWVLEEACLDVVREVEEEARLLL